MKKIIDGFTDLNVSRQRKEQLRNPKAFKDRKKKYDTSLKGMITGRESERKRLGFKRRNLNAKSYRMEKIVTKKLNDLQKVQ